MSERQKATRRLRQAKKAYEENPSVEAHKLVERYILDLYYTTHFPLTEKYIALYPKAEIENQEVLDKRNRIRKELEEEMLNGKKQGSGTNALKLGSRKAMQKDFEDTMEDEENGMDSSEESDDDEFLDLGRK